MRRSPIHSALTIALMAPLQALAANRIVSWKAFLAAVRRGEQ